MASANYVQGHIETVFSQRQMRQLNTSLMNSKNLINLNLKALVNPGLQVMYEDKRAKVEDLNKEKMLQTRKFDNLFHEIIAMSKKSIQVHYSQYLNSILNSNASHQERLA